MLDKIELRHIWEAFSCLSDPEDVLEEHPDTALERIEHAKRHLQVLTDPGLLTEVVRTMPVWCSLTPQGQGSTRQGDSSKTTT